MPRESPVTTRRRPSPLGLSRDGVIAAASRIVDQRGLGELTMRRLAADLGVSVMGLYTYVATKEEVLSEVAGLQLAGLDFPADAATWQESLVSTFVRLHDLMLEHPVLATVLSTQPVDSAPAHRIAEAVLGVLIEHGYDHAAAVELFIALGSLTTGYALNEMARTRSDQPTQQQRLTLLRSLAPDEYPTLIEVAPQLVRWRADGLRDALRRLISG